MKINLDAKCRSTDMILHRCSHCAHQLGWSLDGRHNSTIATRLNRDFFPSYITYWHDKWQISTRLTDHYED